MKKQLINILESDEMCFREELNSGHSYNSKLGVIQKEAFDPILKFMADEYDINLNIFHGLG